MPIAKPQPQRPDPQTGMPRNAAARPAHAIPRAGRTMPAPAAPAHQRPFLGDSSCTHRGSPAYRWRFAGVSLTMWRKRHGGTPLRAMGGAARPQCPFNGARPPFPPSSLSLLLEGEAPLKPHGGDLEPPDLQHHAPAARRGRGPPLSQAAHIVKPTSDIRQRYATSPPAVQEPITDCYSL